MKKDQFLSRRVYFLIAVMGLWGTVIGARLYFLQVVKSADFRVRAEGQQQHPHDIIPPRGVIYDRTGSELAASVKVKSVFAVPKEVEDLGATARALASLTGTSLSEITNKLNSDKDFVWIKRKVSSAEAAAVEAANLSGVHFEEESKRFYPNGELASQVLGYVGVDEKGFAGLEGRYNDSVAGTPGKVVYLSDAHGKSYNQIEQPAQPGANLLTTLDRNYQHFVEQEIREAEERTHAKAIHIIVMDPRNGEILAMANYPTFNPNEYRNFGPELRKNGAIDRNYEPGSTFKILTVGAALEENLATPDDRIDCLNGAIVVAGKRIRDHKSFGVLTVSEILQQSSDVGAITLGLRLQDERMAKYIKLFGFGKTTGIDLPGEERGIVRPISQWQKASIGYISMGQGISVTPIQIASLISMVANGGTLYRPFVVKDVQDPHTGVVTHTEPNGQRVMSAKSAHEMQDMLEKVVTDGTAKSARLDGYRAAGKTGTAQKADDSGKYTKLVASFAGYAPASDPLISMVVVVDEPVGAHHGGEIAAPIFKHIADQILRSRGIVPDIENYAPRYTAAPTRRVSPPPLPQASKPEDMKIIGAKFTGSAKPLPIAPGDIAVPDFRGKSVREVASQVWKLGLEMNYDGSGRAVQQNPPAGTPVRLGTVVDLRFSSK